MFKLLPEKITQFCPSVPVLSVCVSLYTRHLKLESVALIKDEQKKMTESESVCQKSVMK